MSYRTNTGRRPGYGTRYSTARRFKQKNTTNTRSLFTTAGRKAFSGGNKYTFKRKLTRFAEKKYIDTYLLIQPGTTTITTDGKCYPISLVLQGTDDHSRVGNKVTGTSIEINYTVYYPDLKVSLIPANLFIIRVIVFIWKDEISPIPTDIIDTIPGVDIPLFPLNHDKKVKRKVLYDQIHTLYAEYNQGNPTGSSIQTAAVTRRLSVPLTKLRGGLDTINYVSPVLGINELWLLLQSNIPSSIAEEKSWAYTGVYRYNYVDV